MENLEQKLVRFIWFWIHIWGAERRENFGAIEWIQGQHPHNKVYFLGMLLSGEVFSGLYPFRFKCFSRRSLRPLNCQYVVWVLSILMQQGDLLTIISFGIRNWERFTSFFNCINVIKILNLPDTWKNYHGSRYMEKLPWLTLNITTRHGI